MGQLYDNGNSISFMKDIWKVFKGAMVLAQGKKTSTLYMISWPTYTIVAIKAKNQAKLLHYILFHMTQKRVKLFLSKKEVGGD
jgi:hypothetical protein